VTFLLTLLLAFFYYWLLEGLLGATLGKKMAGIQVVDMNGGPCRLRQSLIRNLLRIVDFLILYLVGFFIAVFSRYRQRLGDHIAHTAVVEKTGGTIVLLISVLIWLALLCGSFWETYQIHRCAKLINQE